MLRAARDSEVAEVLNGRVRSCQIDVGDLGLLDGSIDSVLSILAELRAAGWEGLTDYECTIAYSYGDEYPVARVRLWRQATAEEISTYDEHIRQRNEAAELALLEHERAELARLKAKLGEK